MGSRGERTLASLGLRCLRRQQLHSDHGKQLPVLLSENSAGVASATSSPSCSCSSVEGQIDEGQQELRYVTSKLLDLGAASGAEGSQKLSMREFLGIGSWHLQNSQHRSTDEWSIGIRNGCRCSQGIQRSNSETIATRHGDEALILRDQEDLFSRYLQWRSYERSVGLVESQNNTAAAGVSSVDMGGFLSVPRQNWKSSSPSLLASSSALDFLEEPSMNTPLEASSVKRKRKKKMNKHKQKKLRKRDRHRN